MGEETKDWDERMQEDKDGPANEVMKHSNKDYLTWHIFVRFMTETELKKIDTVADTWGKNLCGAMNAYF